MLRLAWLFALLALPALAAAQPQTGSDALPQPGPAALTAALLAPAPLPGAPTLNPEFHPGAPAGGTSLADVSLEERGRDPWLAFDKVQHLTFSFLWTLGTQYALVNKASLSEPGALPISIGASAAVGLAKEVYDWRRSPSRFFSRRDLVADAAGILLATGFILL